MRAHLCQAQFSKHSCMQRQAGNCSTLCSKTYIIQAQKTVIPAKSCFNLHKRSARLQYIQQTERRGVQAGQPKFASLPSSDWAHPVSPFLPKRNTPAASNISMAIKAAVMAQKLAIAAQKARRVREYQFQQLRVKPALGFRVVQQSALRLLTRSKTAD